MKTLKILFYNLLFFLIIISFFEIFLNNFYSKRISFSNRNIVLKENYPSQDTFNEPSQSYINRIKKLNENKNILEKKKYRLRTNEDGYIIGEQNLSNNSKSIDAIFYGGSTTECKYVEESKRFPYLSQKMVNDSLNTNLIFLNAGVSGKTSMQSSFDFLAKGISKKPKIVFLMHNINDLALLIKTGNYWDAPLQRRIVVDENTIEHDIQKILPNSYDFFKRVINILTNESNDEWKNFRNRNYFSDQLITANFRNSINNFIDISNNYNIKLVLMTQFNRLDFTDKLIYNNNKYSDRGIDMDRLINLYKIFNDEIRKASDDHNIDLIDLDVLVSPKRQYIYDEVHLNTAGSIFVSNIIFDYFLKNYIKNGNLK